jgi:hypothetical protein
MIYDTKLYLDDCTAYDMILLNLIQLQLVHSAERDEE